MRRMITNKQENIIDNFSETAGGNIKSQRQLLVPKIELTDESFSAIHSNYNIDVLAAMDEDEGDYAVEIQLTNEGIQVDPDFNVTGECYLKILNLPTSDPQVEGALWNDNGVLKISAGE